MSSFDVLVPDYYKKKRSIPRFHPDLDKKQKTDNFVSSSVLESDPLIDVYQYFRNHSIKALRSGITWSGMIEDLEWGAKTTFHYNDMNYTSIYVYKSYRGAKHMSKYIECHTDEKFCTTPSCEIESYFKSKNVQYVVLEDCPYPEYKLVQRYYGDTVTDRTGIHMMNHIDEGLYILEQLKASEEAKRAYIAHPLVQGDPDLLAFWNSNGPEMINSIRVLMLAVEYRNIANAHLSQHPSGLDNFNLSPIKDVNDMLIADKIQNRKDFELYHQASHPRNNELNQYFIEWLEKLGVSEDSYLKLKNQIIDSTGGLELALKTMSHNNA